MEYSVKEVISAIKESETRIVEGEAYISWLSTDSRNLPDAREALFFALDGTLHNGHNFIEDAHSKGVINFVVNQHYRIPDNIHANFFIVPDTLVALQQIAAYHRKRFDNIDIVAITGSNGKTTIKEWLAQMMDYKKVVKSPKSYNSQTGVAFSVWQIENDHQLGIFEAGISKPGEMELLERMIKPTVGILTNIGDAHAAGFNDDQHKLDEKIKLFSDAEVIIYNSDSEIIQNTIPLRYPEKKLISWGFSGLSNYIRITELITQNNFAEVHFLHGGTEKVMYLPFSDQASVQNVMHCVTYMLWSGVDVEFIQKKVNQLHNLPMRLELKSGIGGSILINDTYNADIQSLKVALEFLSQQAGNLPKVLIISEFDQIGIDDQEFLGVLVDLLQKESIEHIYFVGHIRDENASFFDMVVTCSFYKTTDDLLKQIKKLDLEGKAILIKGARRFALDRVVDALSDLGHSVVMETDFHALDHNLRFFSSRISDHTGIIAVIKASAYGSGSHELGKFLEFKKVNYLAVAFVDEGISLRKSGITLPIMILNPEVHLTDDFIEWNLEPEIYSISFLKSVIESLPENNNSPLKIHLKLDTGMRRLGIGEHETGSLIHVLKNQSRIEVATIFTHLTSSEDESHDDWTHEQISKFERMYDQISHILGYKPARHVLNTAGILRFPQYHFELVRLGLGLYGIDVTGKFAGILEKVHTLKAKVIQIKEVEKEQSVGYSRKGVMSERGEIAIVNIGYADGLLRGSGNGKYSVMINHKLYSIIGNVCMDLTIIELGHQSGVKIGDDVIIFGKQQPIEELARINQTIPYEILCRISPRVKRLYFKG